jgi:putative N6-adenine-specific DNA methylase
MQPELTENLEKKIKKNIYGKPQAIKVISPPGLGETALDEIQSILSSLWFPQKYISELSILKNAIRIDNIHLFAVTELLMRSQCLSDIRLIIFEGKTSGKFAFEKKCREVNWNFYLNKSMTLKIKVDSVASRAFHETGLKEIITDIIQDQVHAVVTGENTHETTCIYADLYKDRLSLSISLAGDPLYKRGYRGTLSASAPLREDAAACCIRKSFKFAKKINANFIPDRVLIPFSGTGTFAFEYLQSCFNFAPVLFAREYALQAMPLFRPENFNFLLKKAKENCVFPAVRIECIDTSESANLALRENIGSFRAAMVRNGFSFVDELFSVSLNDFIKIDGDRSAAFGNVFIPLNPPYGMRLGKNADSVVLYKNIAGKINEISKILKAERKSLLGFVLCPNEEVWSAFCRNLSHAEIETYHFTQGGLDIRVCQFFVGGF